MRKVVIFILLVLLIALPVSAEEFIAPEAPEAAQDLMPVETKTFGDGLWKILQNALPVIQPAVAGGCKLCVCVICIVLLTSLLKGVSGETSGVLTLAAIVAIGGVLLNTTGSMIRLGTDTVKELSEYGKLLLPVMTGALAAQGGAASSAALYAGTVVFDTVLSGAVAGVLIPLIYIFLALSIAAAAIGQESIKKIGDFVKWLMSWFLKVVLYIFTGYMTVTGVVSGGADATAVKAAKITISGMVPVVGGILSDASEAVVVSAGVVKNAAGVYGLLAVAAIWISPFLQIGVQYLLLKATAAVCGVFDVKACTQLVSGFSAAMGLVLAAVGAVCLLHLISTVCFMRGVL